MCVTGSLAIVPTVSILTDLVVFDDTFEWSELSAVTEVRRLAVGDVLHSSKAWASEFVDSEESSV